MKPLDVLAIVGPLLLGGAAGAAAASLTAAEQTMLTGLLGAGVVGAPVTGSALAPGFLPLRAGTWTYRIASGDKDGQSEPHIVQRLENDPSGADWRYTVGTTGDVLIKQTEDAASPWSASRTTPRR